MQSSAAAAWSGRGTRRTRPDFVDVSSPALLARATVIALPGEVDVSPAQGQQLALAKPGICGEPDELSLLLIFRAPRLTLLDTHRGSGWITVKSASQGPGERLNLLGRVVDEGAGASFPPLVGSFGRVNREVEGRLTPAIAIHRRDDRAVLVHRSRRGTGRAHLGEQGLDLARGHPRGRPIPERLHDVPERAPSSPPVRGAGLCERGPVAQERGWLGSAHVLQPAQVLARDLAEGCACCPSLSLRALAVRDASDVLGHELSRGHMRAA